MFGKYVNGNLSGSGDMGRTEHVHSHSSKGKAVLPGGLRQSRGKQGPKQGTWLGGGHSDYPQGSGRDHPQGCGGDHQQGCGPRPPTGRGAETTHRSASRDQRPPVAVLGHRNGNAWLWIDGSSGSNSKNEVESLTPCTSVCGCIWKQGPWQKALGKMRSREHRRAPIRCDWCPAKSWQGLETGEP